MSLTDTQRQVMAAKIQFISDEFLHLANKVKHVDLIEGYSAHAENFRALAQAIREDRVKFEAVA